MLPKKQGQNFNPEELWIKKDYEGDIFYLVKHIALKQDRYWTYNAI